jgi:DNA ligase-1
MALALTGLGSMSSSLRVMGTVSDRYDLAVTLLAELVDTSAAVAATSSRKEKSSLIAEFLEGLEPDERDVAVGFLIGSPRQGRIGVGYAALRDLHGPAAGDAGLQVLEIDASLTVLAEMSGPGSQAARRSHLEHLFGRATVTEREFLIRLMIGEVRQGALDGVMIDAIAKAGRVKAAAVRRANMLRGDLRAVAAVAMENGQAGLAAFRLEVGRPLEPMLAKTADSVPAGLAALQGEAIFEWKLDGARVQVHRDGEKVAVFTRNLRDVTDGLADVVAAVRELPARVDVLDGEVIATEDSGRPLAFQDTMSRFGSGSERDHPTKLTAYFFDILHLDGRDLIDEPASVRLGALAEATGGTYEIPRLITDDPIAAQEFADGAIAAGHEGVMVKALDAPYQAGRRGAAWLKVKPTHTLDLVVLAVEWGHGRRTGTLSNLHLGARDPEAGGFVMLGKTFKGLTDEMLAWQTQRFLELEASREGHIVHVRPEQVVEVAFDGVQVSSRYPGGVALRFARVKRYREDKTAEEADTIGSVRAHL